MASGERVPLARETATAPPSPPPQTRMRSVVRSGRPDDEVPDVVPRILRVSAALGWRLLVVVAALYVIGIVVSYVAAVVVPVAIALLLAALLAPAVHQLQARQVPRGVATALVLIGGLALLGGVLAFVVVTFVRGVPDLATQLTASINDIAGWLRTGPLKLSDTQFSRFQAEILNTLSANQASITAGALTTAATAAETLTEILLVVFTLIFFLHGGLAIWQFLLGIVPNRVRNRVDVAGRRGLAALVSYVRATAVVATVDALAIGIALAVLGIPLAVPLAALVFLGAFIPIIGAVVAGAVAVMIALVAQGLVSALIVLGVVIGVMQLESHVLQPLLLGRAVKLHPLAVVLSIATGLLVGGIAGALLAVPLLAVLNSGIRSLLSEADEHVDPEDVHTSEPEDSGPDEPDLERQPGLGASPWIGEEADHLRGRVGAGRVRVRAAGDASRPGVARAVHGPQLPDRHTVAAHDDAGRGAAGTALDERVAAHLPAAELLDDADGVVRGDGRVRVAVEGDHGHRPVQRPHPRRRAHGGEGRREVGGGALRQPRVHAHGGEDVRVRGPQHRGHRRTGREPCDVHPVAVDRVLRRHLVHDPGEDRRFPGTASLVGRLEPVPVPHRVRGGDLLGVSDEEPVLLRQLAHPRGGGEVVGGLRAAVQHHDQRPRAGPGGGNVERVRPGTGCAPVDRVHGRARERRNRRAGRGRRQVRPHTVGDLGQLPAQELPQPPGRAPRPGDVRRGAGVDARRSFWAWRGTRRVVVAQAFLVDHDLTRHHAHGGGAAERPLDQGRRLGEAAGPGQGRRFPHGVQVLARSSPCVGWCGSDGARGEGGLHRRARPVGAEHLDGRDRRQRQLRADVGRDRGQAEDPDLDGPPGSRQLLQLVAGERQGAERQRPAGDGLVDRRRPGGDLRADRRTDEIGPVRVEALGHQEVDLTEIDRPQVDRDLFTLLDLARGHRTPPAIRQPSIQMVPEVVPPRHSVWATRRQECRRRSCGSMRRCARTGRAVGLRGCRAAHPGTCPVRTHRASGDWSGTHLPRHREEAR